MFPNFKQILGSYYFIRTVSEHDYKNLEPWIQWVSVYTGRDFSGHGVFNLGDTVKPGGPKSVHRELEDMGLLVGAVSSMNLPNDLDAPAFFVPDPWIDTCPDQSNFSKRVSKMMRQVVNDNSSSKVTFASFIMLLECVIRFIPIKRYFYFVKLCIGSLKRGWIRALIFDFITAHVFLGLQKKSRPNFSSVFFNAIAHIQHHYLFNSEFVEAASKNPEWYIKRNEDPFLEAFRFYDFLLTDFVGELNLGREKIVIATGLSQDPYDRIKYYYRLKDHKKFLLSLNIKCASVQPLMTRDFKVSFDSEEHCANAESILSSCKIDGESVFEVKRLEPERIFVTLKFASELTTEHQLICRGENVGNFLNHVSFVALKNGMHSGDGYALFCPQWESLPKKDAIKLWHLKENIISECKVDMRNTV